MTEALAPLEKLVVDHTERGEATGAVLERYAVEAFPTLIFLDREGRETSRLVGVAAAPEIARRARAAAE